MNHDPFKINEAILDMWRDLKAGDDYIHRLEVRNAELVSDNARLKSEAERLRASSFVTAVPVEHYERVIKAGDAMVEELIGRYFGNRLVTDWNAAKEGKSQP
jgi:hypothetical protein